MGLGIDLKPEGADIPAVIVTIVDGSTQTSNNRVYISGYNHSWKYVYKWHQHTSQELVEEGELGSGMYFGGSLGSYSASIYLY